MKKIALVALLIFLSSASIARQPSELNFSSRQELGGGVCGGPGGIC